MIIITLFLSVSSFIIVLFSLCMRNIFLWLKEILTETIKSRKNKTNKENEKVGGGEKKNKI
jgi:hypothetical protein